MEEPSYGPISWQRILEAVEKVRERLSRAIAALEKFTVPYAVIGDHAVAAWVSTKDKSATRNTPEVLLLTRRSDLGVATIALGQSGFHRRHVERSATFLDGPEGKLRDCVTLHFAGEKFRPDDELPAPDVEDVDTFNGVRVLKLDAVVRMELVAYRTLNQVRLDDLIAVGLVDETWYQRLPSLLAFRLRKLIDSQDAHGDPWVA